MYSKEDIVQALKIIWWCCTSSWWDCKECPLYDNDWSQCALIDLRSDFIDKKIEELNGK